MAYQSGRGGYIEVAGDRLDVIAWEAEEASDWEETTGAGSGGFKESLAVRKYLRGTVKAGFDPAKGPKGTPEIAAGSTVDLVLHTAAGESYRATANVQHLRWVTPAGNRITFAFDFESTGAYTYGA